MALSIKPAIFKNSENQQQNPSSFLENILAERTLWKAFIFRKFTPLRGLNREWHQIVLFKIHQDQHLLLPQGNYLIPFFSGTGMMDIIPTCCGIKVEGEHLRTTSSHRIFPPSLRNWNALLARTIPCKEAEQPGGLPMCAS